MKDNPNKRIRFKKTRKIFYLIFITCIIVISHCQPDLPEENIRGVYSLLALTIDLQKKISSPEIQMLYDFSYEIKKDLSYDKPG